MSSLLIRAGDSILGTEDPRFGPDSVSWWRDLEQVTVPVCGSLSSSVKCSYNTFFTELKGFKSWYVRTVLGVQSKARFDSWGSCLQKEGALTIAWTCAVFLQLGHRRKLSALRPGWCDNYTGNRNHRMAGGPPRGATIEQRARCIRGRSGKASWGGSLKGKASQLPCLAQYLTLKSHPTRISWVSEWPGRAP